MSGTDATTPEPWTILRLLQWTTEHLKKTGSSSPRLDAEVLLAEARQCQRIELYTAFAEEPNEEVKAKFREWIKRRAAGEPVAYLVGKKEFYSLTFKVAKGCLIPRGETEHLIIECLDRAKVIRQVEPTRRLEIADVCTGSGCVAITIAKHLPNASILAVDISSDALAIAQSNIELHQTGDVIRLVERDLLDGVDDNSLDFVLSNPPYVSESEFSNLDKSVRSHEPKIALVSGPSGTEIIEQLIKQSAAKLRSKGWFLCELSPMIASKVVELFSSSGQWQDIGLVKDLAGLQRLAVARKK